MAEAGSRAPGAQHAPDATEARGKRLWVLIDAAGLANGRTDIDDSAFANVGCLFTGDLESELADSAPYLALIDTNDEGTKGSSFADTRAALEQLVAHDCAVLLTDDDPALTFAQAHRHFRKFNVVYGPDGTPLFFRYYDGRVLPSVLQVFDGAQLQAFFGPFDAIYLAADGGTTTRLQRVGDQLASTALAQPLHLIAPPC